MNRHLLIMLVFLPLSTAFGQDPKALSMAISTTITKAFPDSTCTFGLASLDKPPKITLKKRYAWLYGDKIGNTQGGYLGKLLDGTYTAYTRGNDLLEKGAYRRGLKIGLWLRWHPNGQVALRQYWKAGVRHGRFAHYHSDGRPRQTGRYKKGQLHGKICHYDENDSIAAIQYKRGKPVGRKAKKARADTPNDGAQPGKKTIEKNKKPVAQAKTPKKSWRTGFVGKYRKKKNPTQKTNASKGKK